MAFDCEQCRKSASGTVERLRVISLCWFLMPDKRLPENRSIRFSLEIWDNYGNRAKAETAFTTGIFDTGDFQAKMITHDFPPEEMACPVFFRKFSPDKEVSSACLYATALGVYENLP